MTRRVTDIVNEGEALGVIGGVAASVSIEAGVAAALTAHTTDATDAHDASAISVVDVGAYFTSTEVEGVLQELGSSAGGTSIPVQPTAPASPADGDLWLDTDETSISDGDAGRLLANVNYRPGSDTTVTTTSTTLHDLDDDITGDPVAQITFTAPSTGAVDIELQVMCGNSTSTIYQTWALRDSGGGVADTEGRAIYGATFMRVTYFVHLQGLTSGASYTYKWAWRAQTAGTVNIYIGPTFGPLVMRAVAAKVI